MAPDAPAALELNTGESAALEWSDRASHWNNHNPARTGKGQPTKAQAAPLILCGHGVNLRVDSGALVVRNGFTHYPQAKEEHRLYPGHWRQPSRIIMLDGSGSLSFDVLDWLGTRNIPLIRIDWRGNVVMAIGGTGSGVERRMSEVQSRAKRDGTWIRLARHVIETKITNSTETLRQIVIDDRAKTIAITTLESILTEMHQSPPATVSEILGIEGHAAAAYFTALQAIPLNWNAKSLARIPEDWRQIGPRSSRVSLKKGAVNRNASHPFNAMLNYAYALLESTVRMALVAAGCDPTIGYLHGSYRDKHALVLDMMEPLRPIVDRAILQFVMGEVFSAGDFILRDDGVVRLHPQLARKVVAKALEVAECEAVTEEGLRVLTESAKWPTASRSNPMLIHDC